MPIDDKESRALIAKRIKYARMCANLKQNEVAAALHITPQAISNYERGLNRVPNSVIYEMATIYGTTVDFLLGVSTDEVPLPKGINDLLGESAHTLKREEAQAITNLYGMCNEFIKYIGINYACALPAAADCMEAATLCFAHLCEKCSGNTNDLKAGEFAGIALKEIDRVQDAFALLALKLQAGISETCATDEE